MRKVTIKKRPSELIIVDSDHGGNKSGHCFDCGASGWIDGLGYPFGAKNVPGAHLKHKKSCSLNELLDDKGRLKSGSKAKRKVTKVDHDDHRGSDPTDRGQQAAIAFAVNCGGATPPGGYADGGM